MPLGSAPLCRCGLMCFRRNARRIRRARQRNAWNRNGAPVVYRWELSEEVSMRNTLLLLSLAAGLGLGFGLAGTSGAGAVPIGAMAMKEAAATTTSPLQPAQYAEY